MKPVTIFMVALAVCLETCAAFASHTIKGTVVQPNGEPVIGANVFLAGTKTGSTTDSNGDFEFQTSGTENKATLIVSHVGYTTVRKTIQLKSHVTLNFVLESDLIALDEVVVTGTFNEASKLQSSVAISTLNSRQIVQRNAYGTGDLLTAVPGNFVDMSAGEVGAQIYPRGLSTGAVADIGFKYSSLQEDGLPVMSTQFQFAVIDMFHRPDATVRRLEAIRGGSASVSAANSPGGIFNFISKSGTPTFGGMAKVSSGVHENGNNITRTDVNFNGPASNSWTYNIGGFYRYDRGAKNLSFTPNRGGQIKANISRRFSGGIFKFYGKLLNDRVTFYRQLPVSSLNKQSPFTGFDLSSSSLIVDVENNIPSAANPSTTRHYNADDAIHVQNYSSGVQFNFPLAQNWQLKNNLKYGYFIFDHFQSSGHNLLPTTVAPNRIHGLSNTDFNSYTYRDARTGEVVAQFENGTAVTENQLGDKVLLTLGKSVDYKVHDVINQLELSKKLSNHDLTLGGYFGYSDIKNTLNLDFILARFEPNPRLLLLTHPNPFAQNPGQPTELQFTDGKGYFAYGFGTYTNFSGSSRIQALFLNDVWQARENLNIDFGLRMELSNHTGNKERWETPDVRDPINGFALGQDGNSATFYDEFFKYGSGDFFDFDFNYLYWSGSLGLNYQFRKNMALYSRITRGIKAPEMTYYINNFVNSDFEKGFEEEIIQGEAGFKANTKSLSFLLTVFYSRLENVPFQQLIVSGDIGQFTPATFNKMRTIGTEIEAAYRPTEELSIDLIATIQDPKFVDFNYYNINRTGSDFSDDFIEKFDGNTINEVPNLSLDITPSYNRGAFSGFATWRFVGERYANRRNTIKLNAFSQFNAGISMHISEIFTASVNVNNVFNSVGLMNLEGIGLPGTTGEDITPELIETVIIPQNRPYFVRPILPRRIVLTLASTF